MSFADTSQWGSGLPPDGQSSTSGESSRAPVLHISRAHSSYDSSRIHSTRPLWARPDHLCGFQEAFVVESPETLEVSTQWCRAHYHQCS